MLMDEFGRDDIHLGKKMVALEQVDQHIKVQFADGSEVTTALLIGADGTHSLTRQYVLGEQVERRYAGYVNWNGLVEISDQFAQADQWTTFVGEGKRVSLMPVAEQRFYFFFDVPLPVGLETVKPNIKHSLNNILRTGASQFKT